MAWLRRVNPAPAAPVVDAATWLQERVWVQRDLHSAELIITEGADGLWVHAWAERAHLVDASGLAEDEVDAADLRGVDLREWLRARDRVEVGVLLHPDRVQELVVLRPQITPVHRISVE